MTTNEEVGVNFNTTYNGAGAKALLGDLNKVDRAVGDYTKSANRLAQRVVRPAQRAAQGQRQGLRQA